MTDNTNNILSMPAKTTKATNPFLAPIPKEAQGSDAYTMTTVNYSRMPTKGVPDLMSGNKRNKHWAAYLTLGVIPEFNQVPPGPVMLPNTPVQLFDADDLDTLRARLDYELDKAFALAKLQKEDPIEFQRCEKEFLASLEREFGDRRSQ